MARAPRAEVGIFRYERMQHPLLPFPAFVARVLRSLSVAALLVGLSLAGGMLGYHVLEGLGWLDSYINAAMILSGMGPLWSPKTDGGKLFAGAYALYSGLAVLGIAGVVLAPLAHRLLHRFHAADEDPLAATTAAKQKKPTRGTRR
jgi:hypothetical protein